MLSFKVANIFEWTEKKKSSNCVECFCLIITNKTGRKSKEKSVLRNYLIFRKIISWGIGDILTFVKVMCYCHSFCSLFRNGGRTCDQDPEAGRSAFDLDLEAGRHTFNWATTPVGRRRVFFACLPLPPSAHPSLLGDFSRPAETPNLMGLKSY